MKNAFCYFPNLISVAFLLALSSLGSMLSANAGEFSYYAVSLNDEGIKALKQQQWSMAIDKLTAATMADPTYLLARYNLSTAHNNYGLYLAKTDSEEALKEFRHAVYLARDSAEDKACRINLRDMIIRIGKNPDNPGDHIQLGDTAKADGDLVSAVVEYRSALQITDDQKIRKKLSDAEEMLSKRYESDRKKFQTEINWSANSQNPATASLPDYAKQDAAEIRKHESGEPFLVMSEMPVMPVRVYLGADSTSLNGDYLYTPAVLTNYSELARKAVLEWCAHTDGQLTCVFVDNPRDAQICCEWTTDTRRKRYSFTGGETTKLTEPATGKVVEKSLIFLDANTLRSGADFYSLCLHEIGHALGAWHTSHPQDVMYGAEAYGQTKKIPQTLSKNDIKQIRLRYCDPIQAKSLALTFGLDAYVNKNYQAAYKLLSPEQQKAISLPEFQHHIEKEHPTTYPDTFSIYQTKVFSNFTRFALYGLRGMETFYYFVEVTHASGGGFEISQFRRVSANSN